MKTLITTCILAGLVVIGAYSCKKEEVNTHLRLVPVLPDTELNYANVNIPPHISNTLLDNTPMDNPTTDAGATLGRVLFYDPQLSINNRISCGSCHSQDKAFADGNQFSQGFANKITDRNSPPVVNCAHQSGFFWDLRASTLEEMVMMPIENHVEMGLENFDNLAEKLAMLDYYPQLFQNAFGSSEINQDRISKALAQFLRAMRSYESKYDEGVDIEFFNFSAQELAGQELFDEVGCDNCHGGMNFSGWSGGFANIGLDEVYEDPGLGGVEPNPNNPFFGEGMEGYFKIPTLRNIEFTAPYMHDGRFETLLDVINHYDHGVQPHYNLHYTLQDDPGNSGGVVPKQMNLTESEKEALIAFLRTLSDYNYMSDERFSNPFVAQ